MVIFDDGKGLNDPFLLSFSELRAVGSDRLQREPDIVRERASAVVGGQPATLVYTSGTTGPPKAAILTHANIMWTLRRRGLLPALGVRRAVPVLPAAQPRGRAGHERTRPHRHRRRDVVRPEPRHGGQGSPRLPADGVLRGAAHLGRSFRPQCSRRSSTSPGRRGTTRFIRLGRNLEARSRGTGAPRAWDVFPHALLDATVGTRIRHGVGLDRAHILITAAAPVHPDLVRWLHAIGLPVVELYGQTEVCGPTTCNPPEDNRVGTVGRALPGVHVAIAGDGEILVQGGNVCAGYYNDPASTRRCSTRMVGCTRVIWAYWTPTGTSDSPDGRKISSSPPPDRMSPHRTSRWS